MKVHTKTSGAAAALLCAALLLPASPAADDDDESAAPARVVRHGDGTAVRLPAALQQQGGIEVFTPEAVALAPETPVIGRVVDLQPLLELRSSQRQARADYEVARAALGSSTQALERLQMLEREAGNVSARQLQQARAQRDADQARATAARVLLEDLEYRALQDWGGVIAGWLRDADSSELAALGRREQLLLLLTLPAGSRRPEAALTAQVDRDGDRARAVPAQLVSAAPRTVDGMQGETWFYRLPAGDLRTGMRVQAWLPLGGPEQAGVLLPAQAVIRHAGRLWYFERQGGELFVRREAVAAQPVGDRYFVPGAALAQAEIVRTGAQTLLSEEFRARIPDEDDDP